MANIWVEGKTYAANGEQNLLHACLSLGFDLPYFCWHPALGSVGACRQCAVKQFKDEKDTHGKLVMACMTPASEGARISIADPEAVEFRKAIVEGLMQNHPHDCPVCDEGGECHLQDMTLMTGHDYRAYRFEKRTFRNQYLGPLVNHEMNRCIQCYRCVRYYSDYAGGKDLNAFAMRDIVYFGRDRDGVLESEFSGNLVEICPTGVFTDATLKRHYTRKWDLQFAPSVCAHCGLGCNISPAERYDSLRRVVNRFNYEVNGYFLCDRGRYGYEFVNSPQRITAPTRRGESISTAEAESQLELLANGRVLGIGSPRASLESNFALRRLVGAERFFAGISQTEHALLARMRDILQSGRLRSASLRDVERSDAVLILGEDVPNTAPRMALSVRQAVRQQPLEAAEALKIPLWLDQGVRHALQDRRGPLYIATPVATRLDEIATETFRLAPDDIARFALDLPERIVQAMHGAKRRLVIAGSSLAGESIVRAAARAAESLHADIAFIMPEPNSLGLSMMGADSLDAALEAVGDDAVRNDAIDTVIVLENDLYRRAPRERVDRFLGAVGNVIVLDHLANETTAKANLLLPAATFAESDGTFISSEGRAQRFFQVYVAPGAIQESWRWLDPAEPRPSGSGLQKPGFENLDDLIGELITSMPVFAPIRAAAPPAGFRMNGARIPREPDRFSGRTAMFAQISVHDPAPPEDRDSPLAFSMEGATKQPPAPLIPFFWAPNWNSIQSVNKFQDEVGEGLRGGSSGVRMFERNGQGAERDAGAPPPPFEPRENEWLIVPIHHIFGSEELSRHAQALAELAPAPFLALNQDDAARLHSQAGDVLEALGVRVPLRIDASLPRGVAGLLGVPGLPLPAWSEIARL
ncbi:MAG TPA: NADH-quinone oxidoreductase subunit NuoG [Bryobacteraceae bacterium]